MSDMSNVPENRVDRSDDILKMTYISSPDNANQASTSRDKIQYGAGPKMTQDKPYIFQMTGQKTFAKNWAIETTYKIEFTDAWKGR